MAIGLVIAGFAVLVFGGEALVAGAVSAASRLRISPMVIGLTIVAAGTSAPELLTSVMAVLKNNPDIAVGNVVGSNIFNILAILGIAALLSPLSVARTIVRMDLPLLVVATSLFLLLAQDHMFSRWEGSLFLIGLNGFIFYSVMMAKKDRKSTSDEVHEEFSVLKNWKFDVVYLTIGFIGLLGGAQLALEGGVQLGHLFGLSERIIGITIISVGTGLPELATSVVASYRGRNDLAIANVIGSNMVNTLGVTGVAATAKPFQMNPQIVTTDTFVMAVATLSVIPLIWIGRFRLSRLSGALLLLGYVAYLGLLIVRPQ